MQQTYHEKEISALAREKCGVIYALELVGGKWRLPVLWKLSRQETTASSARAVTHSA